MNVPLKLGDEDLDEVHHVWSVEEVNVKGAWLLLGVVLPIDLVSHLFLLESSDLLHFVEVNVKLLSVESVVVKLVLGHGGSFWVLEASEGVETLTFSWEDLEALNSSELLEKSLKFSIGGLRREVLDVEIASLLGVLELSLFLLLFLLSVGLLEGFSDVNLSSFNILTIEVIDGVVGSSDTVFFVGCSSVGMLETDEGKRGLNFLAWHFLLLEEETLDVAVLGEDLPEFLFVPRLWEALDVDVVDTLLRHIFLVLGVVGDSDQIFLGIGVVLLNGSICRVDVLEGHETVANGSVIFLQGRSGGKDLTLVGETLLQVL